MAAFTLYPLVDTDDAGTGVAREILDPYVEAYDDVEALKPDIEIEDEGAELAEIALAIDSLDTFAELYLELEQYPEFSTLRLWGPESERFPIIVGHFALQQLSDPDLHEFHALDDERTIVVCESQLEQQQAIDDVPAAALR